VVRDWCASISKYYDGVRHTYACVVQIEIGKPYINFGLRMTQRKIRNIY